MPLKIKPRQFASLLRIALQDIRYNMLGQAFPPRPRILNLLANDICNSRCRMCNVWRRKKDIELTPGQLAGILRSPFFARVSYVGISGGEPTLRKDLPELCEAVIRSCHSLKGLGIITNAINSDDVIARVEAASARCRAAGIPFNIMVSMDGIGDVHDRIRGRKKNFEKGLAVIRYFKNNTDVPVSVGCTIVRENVWHVDEVLDYCCEHGIYARFRVAEFINRLYNSGLTGSIRNFSETEFYHLGLFFNRLQYAYEASSSIKRTYGNIAKMLMTFSPRFVGCIFANKAVTLDCRGQLLYCAPKSPVLGDCRRMPAAGLYRNNIGIRREILNNDCAGCIHDYAAEPTIRELGRRAAERVWRKILSFDTALSTTHGFSKYSGGKPCIKKPDRVLITGWYGTETAGDKAILGEVIHRIKKDRPGVVITLSSLFPDYSRWTVKELGYGNVRIVPVYSRDFFKAIATCDEVIMGGGPLMHINDLGFVLTAFFRAKKKGKLTRIAGCGLGPLDRGSGYVEAVKRILFLSDTIELRDAASARWARAQTGRADIITRGDYARDYVLRWAGRGIQPEKRPCLNLYLRDFTSEYKGALSDKEFLQQKERFEAQLGRMIHAVCRPMNLRPRLLAMHHFVIGGDDRMFNRRFARQYLADLDPVVEIQPFTLNEILESMRTAVFSICMRFHSVLFAHTLDVPFMAIDYTGGGKIHHYLDDHARLEAMLSMDAIADGNWRQAFESLFLSSSQA